jgi:putative cell wall-binding protein
MDVNAVQALLSSKVTACRSGYTCLKDFHQTTTNEAADAMCHGYSGTANESAAQIIAKVGQACGISQKVLLVLLEKEQSLVSDTWPSQGQYNTATGFACPDSSVCDTEYYGFFNQVYHAARQFKRYGNPPGTSAFFTWYPIGQPSSVRYSPNAACGSSTLTIKNAATAALYYYTPYQPNAAALANPYGVGNGCSSYGNRNFWVLYSDWFGPPNTSSPPFGNFEGMSVSSGTLSVVGWAIDPASASTSVSVRLDITDPAGRTGNQTVVAGGSRPDVGTAYANMGAGNAHGLSLTVPATGAGQFTACLTVIALPFGNGKNTSLGCRTMFYSSAIGGSPSLTRIAGAERYDTAAALSKLAYPSAGVPVVYIATGENYADALSAAPAASIQGGPLLLVYGQAVPASTVNELRRLAPKHIVVVGGVSAIAAQTYNQLAGFAPTITRVAGSDRYGTAIEVAKYAFAGATSVVLATGQNFPDALSASAAAGATSRPVLLTHGEIPQLEDEVRGLLVAQRVTSVTVVGGPAAVSTGVSNDLTARGYKVDRLSGEDRYLTNSVVNAANFKSAATVYLATGAGYADALAAAAIAGARKSPLFLSPGMCVVRATGAAIGAVGAKSVIVVGGSIALNSDVMNWKPC